MNLDFIKIPSIDIIQAKGGMNWIVEWIYQSFFSFVIVLLIVVFGCFLLMAWALDLDNKVWNICMFLIQTFVFFSLFVLFDKGLITLPI